MRIGRATFLNHHNHQSLISSASSDDDDELGRDSSRGELVDPVPRGSSLAMCRDECYSAEGEATPPGPPQGV